jgi:hypothetical protein
VFTAYMYTKIPLYLEDSQQSKGGTKGQHPLSKRECEPLASRSHAISGKLLVPFRRRKLQLTSSYLDLLDLAGSKIPTFDL